MAAARKRHFKLTLEIVNKRLKVNLFQQVSWKTKESVGHGFIGFEILKNNW